MIHAKAVPALLALPVCAVLTVTGATPAIVDLSVDLETTPNCDSNLGANLLQDAAKETPVIRTTMVLEHGKIVASYVRGRVDPEETYGMWSVTKSWTSLIIGMMVDSGSLFTNETLGDVFPDLNGTIWPVVENAQEVQAVTIESMLTMTSGLVDPEEDWTDWRSFDFANLGGATLVDSLSQPDLGVKGEFSYLSANNILSYVIAERSGLSPRQFAAQNILPALGISDDEIGWYRNDDGMEHAFSGIQLNSIQMAKFGQLYLQGGLSGPVLESEQRVVSASWVQKSTSALVEDSGFGLQYGYLFWIFDGASFGVPDIGSFYCALGLGGQMICVHNELDRVFVQQKDLAMTEEEDTLDLTLLLAFNKSISFEETEESDKKVEENEEKVEDNDEGKDGKVEENGEKLKENSTSSAMPLFASVMLSSLVSACAIFLM